MNFGHYLPNTEKRIERLRSVVNKRPVAILLPGGSITELGTHIGELQSYDICYFGLNHFELLEADILGKIGKQLSVIMDSASPTHRMNNIIPFLERQENNLLISAKQSFVERDWFDYEGFLKQYDGKLLFFETQHYSLFVLNPQIPNLEYPLSFPAQCSFSILLPMAVIGQASKILIFGADGGRIEGLDLYYKGCRESPEKALDYDTERFNKSMALIMDRVYDIYKLDSVGIYNCSIHSRYTAFPRISYDEALAQLKGE